jgi:hypothetical protein
MTIFDQKLYDQQVAADRAETARLKALWAKENSVDTQARRAEAMKAAEEQRMRETPSPEAVELANRIFKHHQRFELVLHRVLGEQHVFTYKSMHPFRQDTVMGPISIPPDRLSDVTWCRLLVQEHFARHWVEMLENEARLSTSAAESLRSQRVDHDLAQHEADQRSSDEVTP